MTCTHSIGCTCTRCRLIRRHAYREGLADAHRVYSRSRETLGGPRISLGVLAKLLPALDELEWTGIAFGENGERTEPGCPECGGSQRMQAHEADCPLADAMAQARVARLQPDLFGSG